MLKIDKEESDDDSDRPANRSTTNTPRKIEPQPDYDEQIHVNNVSLSMPTNVEIPLQSLPKVSVDTAIFKFSSSHNCFFFRFVK